MPAAPDPLDARLIAAHGAGDGALLARLYAEAAETATGDARWFYLTQAFVFALDTGAPEADRYERRLAEAGRA